MLDFLSNPSWINPQLDYLIWLQNIRIGMGGVLDNFFLSLTRLGEMSMPTLIMCIIYWCVDSKAGLYLFSLNAFSLMFTQFLKMIACVYRPWVLSDKVTPPQAAFRTAGGYSFPSGHSTAAASSIGGIAYWYRSIKPLCILLVIIVLLVGFSRNYLGVHTPQDVVIGLLTGFVFIFAVNKLINWMEKDKNRYLYVLAAVNVLSFLILLYLCNKTYPIDYVNGKVLVNPYKSLYNTFLYFGWTLGMLNGAFLCRRFFPFDAKVGTKLNKAIRFVVGIALAALMFNHLEINFWGHIQRYRLTFVTTFLIAFSLTAVYPYVFSRINNFLYKKL